VANELKDLDIVNVGAAGTFVVRKQVSQAKLRTEILRSCRSKQRW
jgi:NAD-specific glutamate dehydrogenase